MKIKKAVLILIAVIVVCVAFVAFLSIDRAGGEIGFDAIILSIEDDIITAEVTGDEASFFSAKLPKRIVFNANDSGETNLSVGDIIHGSYLKGTINGENVRVVSIVIKSVS